MRCISKLFFDNLTNKFVDNKRSVVRFPQLLLKYTRKWLNRYLAAATTNKDTSQQRSTRRIYSSTVQMIYKGPSLGKLGPTCTSFYSFVWAFFLFADQNV